MSSLYPTDDEITEWGLQRMTRFNDEVSDGKEGQHE